MHPLHLGAGRGYGNVIPRPQELWIIMIIRSSSSSSILFFIIIIISRSRSSCKSIIILFLSLLLLVVGIVVVVLVVAFYFLSSELLVIVVIAVVVAVVVSHQYQSHQMTEFSAHLIAGDQYASVAQPSDTGLYPFCPEEVPKGSCRFLSTVLK